MCSMSMSYFGLQPNLFIGVLMVLLTLKKLGTCAVASRWGLIVPRYGFQVPHCRLRGSYRQLTKD